MRSRPRFVAGASSGCRPERSRSFIRRRRRDLGAHYRAGLAEEGFPNCPGEALEARADSQRGSGAGVAEKLELGEMPRVPGSRGRWRDVVCPSSTAQPAQGRGGGGITRHKTIPALSYFLSFLALKLIGTERYAHLTEHAFDPGLGLFAGLYVLQVHGDVHLLLRPGCGPPVAPAAELRQAGRSASAYEVDLINLDFHTIPHYGEQSVLETHWAGSRNKAMKGALTLFAQDAASKLILYTAADIQRDEASEQVSAFSPSGKSITEGFSPPLSLTPSSQVTPISRS